MASASNRPIDLDEWVKAIQASIEAQGWPSFDPSRLPGKEHTAGWPAPAGFATDADQEPDPSTLPAREGTVTGPAPASFAPDADQDPEPGSPPDEELPVNRHPAGDFDSFATDAEQDPD